MNTGGSAGQTSSGGGGVSAGGQTSSGGGGMSTGGAAAADAAVPDGSPSDASAPPLDGSILDGSVGSPDASSSDASASDGGGEASTCQNAVEDPGERCCTATDRAAFVGEVAAAFAGEFPATVCLPRSEIGVPTGGFLGTGARWCTSNNGADCSPGCILPTAWTNATATFNGENHTLAATVTISPFYAPISGQVLGIGASCTVQISGSGTLSATFDVVDHGTYVGGALPVVDGSIAVEALDLILDIPPACSLLTDVQGLDAAIRESARAAVLDVVQLTFATLRHDCAY